MSSGLTKNDSSINLPMPEEQIKGMLADKYVHALETPEILKKYGISEATFYRYLKHPAVLQMRVDLSGSLIKNRMITSTEDLAIKMLESVNDDTIDKMQGLQRVTSYGILVDKARLLRGEATEIHEHRLDPEYVALKKAEIVTELQRRGMIETPQDVVL